MKRATLIFLTSVFFAATIFSQASNDYSKYFSESDLRTTVKFLSGDGFEGRAPGSRGGELAAKYIAHRLELAGIKPGNNGSYFQPVSLVGLTPDPNTVMDVTRSSDSKNFQFNFGKDFVGFTDLQKDDVSVEGDLVFVGYGIDAPEQNWNDYKGDASQYKDKILLMLVNDPPATAAEPELFGGKALTYYGRWTYKYEEAARKGAKGVILIHTDASAGYGWNVVETSFGGTERFDIARSETDKSPALQMKAWMRDSSVMEFIKFSGTSLNSLIEKAKTRDFQPVDLNTRISIDLKAKLKRVDSNNVIGIWEGADPKLKDEYVVYTAHWDHLGVGKPNASGDTIYNGALDNASGVAQVIALADAFTKLPKNMQPKRSQVFLFVTAEEQGLLGSEWYAKHPVFPLDKTAANINIDGGNFYGKTKNFGALGAERSSLEVIVNDELAKRSMKFMPDNRPEQGSFFRSDHFPFAKKGVPALSIRSGDDFIGREKGWADKFFADFNKNHYHQPSDEFREDWQFDGMVQTLDIAMAIGLRASNIEKLPAYKQSDEFARAQPNRK
ncbi:MAG: M28 family peptidase [Pyrinomonadaceae bacterium]|nr:M28 family peptidase [Pyrinomonadaceae bacterium]